MTTGTFIQGAWQTCTAAEKAHYDLLAKLEGGRQSAIRAATNQAGVKAAELSYYRQLLASARANGIQWGHLAEAIFDANGTIE